MASQLPQLNFVAAVAAELGGKLFKETPQYPCTKHALFYSVG